MATVRYKKHFLIVFAIFLPILCVLLWFVLWKNKIKNFNTSQYQKYYQAWAENLPYAKEITKCRNLLDVKKDSIITQYKKSLLNQDRTTTDSFYLVYYEKLKDISVNFYDLTYYYDLGYPEYTSIYIDDRIEHYNPIEFGRVRDNKEKRLNQEINKLRGGVRQELQHTYCPDIADIEIAEQNKPIICAELTKYEMSKDFSGKPVREDFEFEEEYISAQKRYELNWASNLSSCTDQN